MAKVALNSALAGISGTIDNWVYRQSGDGVILSKRPVNDKPPTTAQLAVREQFSAAVAYAKAVLADPVEGPLYAAAAAAKGMRARALAVADFLTPPEVSAIDTAAYHGAIGDVIKVRADDEFKVTGVTVAIRDGSNAVLEQGAATLTDGVWHYAVTTAIAAGTAVTIAATATDRPGHAGTRIVQLVVA